MVILLFCVFSPVYTLPYIFDGHFATLNEHEITLYMMHEFEYRHFIIYSCSCTMLKVQSVVYNYCDS